MLAYKTNGAWIGWQGEAVSGTWHPTNIEALWTDAQLAAAGFARVVSQNVPSGKMATAWVLTDVSGVPTQVPTLADAPNPVPEIITDRQFYQQLAVQGVITQDEALAAVGPGTLPATLANLIGKLPAESQFDARMKLTAAVQFHRSSPLTDTLRQLFGWTVAQTDDFWRASAALT